MPAKRYIRESAVLACQHVVNEMKSYKDEDRIVYIDHAISYLQGVLHNLKRERDTKLPQKPARE